MSIADAILEYFEDMKKRGKVQKDMFMNIFSLPLDPALYFEYTRGSKMITHRRLCRGDAPDLHKIIVKSLRSAVRSLRRKRSDGNR